MANPFAHLLPPESPAPAPAPANQLISEAATRRQSGPGGGSGAGGFTIYEDKPGDYQSKETPPLIRLMRGDGVWLEGNSQDEIREQNARINAERENPRKQKKVRKKAGNKAEKKRETTRKGEREQEMKTTGKMMRGGY
jgi:hypothetical protein